MSDHMARQAVAAYRLEKTSEHPRRPIVIAKYHGVSLPEMHKAANCPSGENCNGKGCRL